MPAKSTLRWLVALEITLLFIYSQVAELKPSANLQPFGVYDSASPVNQGKDVVMNRLEWAVGIILLLIGLAAYVGLLRFMPWGRRWYVIYHALSLALLPLGKPVLTNGWESLLTGSSAMVTGAVLALLFLTPLKEHFGKKRAAAPEPARLVIPTILSEGNPIDRIKEHSQEKETTAPEPEGLEALRTLSGGNLIDRFTDWLFPKSAAARAAEEPPERKKERRALLLQHYIFLLFTIFSVLLADISPSGLGLVIVALCVVLANLAQRKGDSFAMLCPALVAAYCVVYVFVALFGFMLTNFSRNTAPIFLLFIAALILLFLLEIRTYKFVRKYDMPPSRGTEKEVPTPPEP